MADFLMPGEALSIPNEIAKLSLGEVFQYILSMEWEKVPEQDTNTQDQDKADEG